MSAGRPLFADIGAQPISLECVEAVRTQAATHLRYRVIR